MGIEEYKPYLDFNIFSERLHRFHAERTKPALTYLVAYSILNLFLFVLSDLDAATAAKSTEFKSVSIQLRWTHQFQFAGYYAAIEKGFYAEEGLQVALREAAPSQDRISPVLRGQAQYGVGDAGILKLRIEGEPLVVVVQIFQHSPGILMTRRDCNIFSPYELRGKTIMIPSDPVGSSSVRAMLLETVGGMDQFTVLHRTRDEKLISGQVDAVAGYLSNELFHYKRKGLDINIIDPRSYGIDFYGDNLFTTEREFKEHPDRGEKVRRATIRGWDR